jgi:2-keto-4-pentenoate hydratase/2-oxohepta-3-ene-1,7-dioic acid hydratase in catechol pathway
MAKLNMASMTAIVFAYVRRPVRRLTSRSTWRIIIVVRLKGAVMQDCNTDDMIFNTATLVEILSEAMTLEPGDVIATGTPSGVGYARTPPVFMRPGDRIEVASERIGTLSNTVARRSADLWDICGNRNHNIRISVRQQSLNTRPN